ncbi:DUF1569 domain-containing protein [Roseobacter sp. A03A-229]
MIQPTLPAECSGKALAKMNRRRFAKYVVSGAFLGVAGGGYFWLNAARDQSQLGLDLMLDKLDTLAKSPLDKAGDWDPTRTFHHLAQSVEFSMSGFPEEKSSVFQRTVGQLAFKVFSARGKMSHGLDEVIPGEVVQNDGEALNGLLRLKSALLTFREYEADLKPHFAYGRLDKDDYAIAHVLHINNHLEEFRIV